jgi:hypothetical protein
MCFSLLMFGLNMYMSALSHFLVVDFWVQSPCLHFMCNLRTTNALHTHTHSHTQLLCNTPWILSVFDAHPSVLYAQSVSTASQYSKDSIT